ncbi:MAG: hypothetical protein GXO60_06300 [Epsilonproteobacteria bacterium]|nr:hypothetical protein [Campylobacterota bacterium]
MSNKKEELLKEIERLISYDSKEQQTINPDYLEYLQIDDLLSIKKSLLKRVGKLSSDDIEWLQQFKKDS